MREIVTKALLTLKQDFGESIFESPRFRGAILDVPITTNAKKIRFVLTLAICEMNAYKRLKEVDPKILINEMHSQYSIDKKIAEITITSLAAATMSPFNDVSQEILDDEVTSYEEIQEVTAVEEPKQEVVKPPQQEVVKPPQQKVVKPRLHNIIDFGGIKWRVLKITEEGELLVISASIVTKMAYHNRRIPITWEECDLRQYLNENFYKKFSEEDRERIVESTTRTNFNERYLTAGGAICKDKIFVLSIKEAEVLFKNNIERISKYKNTPDFWWLRSPGQYSVNTAFVNSGGAIDYEGESSVYSYENNKMKHVGYRALGVRPVMYIKGA